MGWDGMAMGQAIQQLELLVWKERLYMYVEGGGDWRAMRALSEYLCMNFKQL